MKEEIQQKFLEMQTLTAQIKKMQQQAAQLEQQRMELQNLADSLEEVKKLKAGTEILAPMGAGIFLKADIKETDRVIMNVGANVTVNKSVDEASEVIQHQIEQLAMIEEEMNMELRTASIRAQQLNQDIQAVQ
jgi:prefoldin alpha subunit